MCEEVWGYHHGDGEVGAALEVWIDLRGSHGVLEDAKVMEVACFRSLSFLGQVLVAWDPKLSFKISLDEICPP